MTAGPELKTTGSRTGVFFGTTEDHVRYREAERKERGKKIEDVYCIHLITPYCTMDEFRMVWIAMGFQ